MSYSDKIEIYKKLTADIFSNCNCVNCYEKMKAAGYLVVDFKHYHKLEEFLETFLKVYLPFYNHCGYKNNVRNHFTILLEAILLKGEKSEASKEKGFLKPENLPFRKHIRKILKQLNLVSTEKEFFNIMRKFADKIIDGFDDYYMETLKKVRKNVKQLKMQATSDAHQTKIVELEQKFGRVLAQLIDASKENERLQAEMHKQLSVPQALNRVIAELRHKVADLQTEVDLQKNINDTLVRLNSEVVAEREQFRQQLTNTTIHSSTSEDISDIEGQIMKLTADKDYLREKNIALEHENTRVKSDVQTLRSTCQTLRAENNQLKDKVQMLQTKSGAFEDLVEDMETEIGELVGHNLQSITEIDELRGSVTKVQSEKTKQALEFTHQLEVLSNELSLRESHIKTNAETIRNLEGELKSTKTGEISDIATAKSKLINSLRAILAETTP